jgi:hypothetical protein
MRITADPHALFVILSMAKDLGRERENTLVQRIKRRRSRRMANQPVRAVKMTA